MNDSIFRNIHELPEIKLSLDRIINFEPFYREKYLCGYPNYCTVRRNIGAMWEDDEIFYGRFKLGLDRDYFAWVCKYCKNLSGSECVSLKEYKNWLIGND